MSTVNRQPSTFNHQPGQKPPLEQSIMSEPSDCESCRESLYGRRYTRVENKPYCISCYDSRLAHTCKTCRELIGHNARELFYEDRHYHEQCFRCSNCDRSLANAPFTCQQEALLCSECYCSKFSSRCVACDKSVPPGMRKMEFGGSTWHEACFTCHRCKQPFGSKAFVPENGLHYCVPCYEHTFSPRCFHCKQALVKGGVTYQEETWHRECLVCTGCQVQLVDQNFTSQGDSPYCISCFSKLYAQMCEACSKPITGLDGGKFVSFEERQWHPRCFTCSRCSVSLVGAGFFPKRDQILCHDCNEKQ